MITHYRLRPLVILFHFYIFKSADNKTRSVHRRSLIRWYHRSKQFGNATARDKRPEPWRILYCVLWRRIWILATHLNIRQVLAGQNTSTTHAEMFPSSNCFTESAKLVPYTDNAGRWQKYLPLKLIDFPEMHKLRLFRSFLWNRRISKEAIFLKDKLCVLYKQAEAWRSHFWRNN